MLVDDHPGGNAGDQKFEDQAHLARQALVAGLGHLVIIVEEADRAEAQSHEQAGPDIGGREVHPKQHRRDHGGEDHEPAHGRRAALGEMGLRAIGADRLSLALAHAQPADEFGTDHQADDERRRDRRARAEGQIADEVEDAREVQGLGKPVKHQFVSPSRAASPRAATRRDSPTPLEPLTRIASPARISFRMRGMALAVSGTWA